MIVIFVFSERRNHKFINLKDYLSKRLEDWSKENILYMRNNMLLLSCTKEFYIFNGENNDYLNYDSV